MAFLPLKLHLIRKRAALSRFYTVFRHWLDLGHSAMWASCRRTERAVQKPSRSRSAHGTARPAETPVRGWTSQCADGPLHKSSRI